MTDLRILHVDDDDNIRALAALAFDLAGGVTVHSAASGSEALRLVAEGLRPDVVLLDVMMPGMDGPAVLAALAEMPEAAGAPVIFMTAQTQDYEVARLTALGALGVVIKPFDPMTLPTQIAQLLDAGA